MPEDSKALSDAMEKLKKSTTQEKEPTYSQLLNQIEELQTTIKNQEERISQLKAENHRKKVTIVKLKDKLTSDIGRR